MSVTVGRGTKGESEIPEGKKVGSDRKDGGSLGTFTTLTVSDWSPSKIKTEFHLPETKGELIFRPHTHRRVFLPRHSPRVVVEVVWGHTSSSLRPFGETNTGLL